MQYSYHETTALSVTGVTVSGRARPRNDPARRINLLITPSLPPLLEASPSKLGIICCGTICLSRAHEVDQQRSLVLVL